MFFGQTCTPDVATLEQEVVSVQAELQAIAEERENVQVQTGELKTAIINAGAVPKLAVQAGVSSWPSWLIPAGLLGLGVYFFTKK